MTNSVSFMIDSKIFSSISHYVRAFFKAKQVYLNPGFRGIPGDLGLKDANHVIAKVSIFCHISTVCF